MRKHSFRDQDLKGHKSNDKHSYLEFDIYWVEFKFMCNFFNGSMKEGVSHVYNFATKMIYIKNHKEHANYWTY